MRDLIIIGASAAGATASIYAGRRNLDFLIISENTGGEVAQSGEVGNWPGIIQTDGITLSESFRKHMEAVGIKPELGVKVNKVYKEKDFFVVEGMVNNQPKRYEARTVIIATGAHPRKLNIEGEVEFSGKGVSYCTTCDGPLFKNKQVVTIGGGNSAMESALMLAEIARNVIVLNINDNYGGEAALLGKIQRKVNIKTVFNAATQRIFGGKVVEGVEYKDTKSSEVIRLAADGVFVHIGLVPNSEMVPEQVKKNKFGEVEVNIRGETNLSGLFAAGDVTSLEYKQIVIAAGQGATAALSAISYLNKNGVEVFDA